MAITTCCVDWLQTATVYNKQTTGWDIYCILWGGGRLSSVACSESRAVHAHAPANAHTAGSLPAQPSLRSTHSDEQAVRARQAGGKRRRGVTVHSTWSVRTDQSVLAHHPPTHTMP